MKSFAPLMLAALLGPVVGGALGPAAQAQQPDPAAAPLVKVTDAKLPFAVSLPKGWVGLNLKDGLGGVTITSQAKPPAALMRLLFIPKNGKVVNLNSEFKSFESAVKDSGAALSMQSEQAANYGGVSGLMRQYTIKNKTGTLIMRVWFGNGAKNFYSFQLTAPDSLFAKINPLFNKVLATVQF